MTLYLHLCYNRATTKRKGFMSNNINTTLYERATEMVDHFYGKLPATLIEKAINEDDLDALKWYVTSAEAMVAEEMFHADNVL